MKIFLNLGGVGRRVLREMLRYPLMVVKNEGFEGDPDGISP